MAAPCRLGQRRHSPIDLRRTSPPCLRRPVLRCPRYRARHRRPCAYRSVCPLRPHEGSQRACPSPRPAAPLAPACQPRRRASPHQRADAGRRPGGLRRPASRHPWCASRHPWCAARHRWRSPPRSPRRRPSVSARRPSAVRRPTRCRSPCQAARYARAGPKNPIPCRLPCRFALPRRTRSIAPIRLDAATHLWPTFPRWRSSSGHRSYFADHPRYRPFHSGAHQRSCRPMRWIRHVPSPGLVEAPGPAWNEPSTGATKPPPKRGLHTEMIPAATYSPRGIPPKYHRRWRA